MISVDVKSNIKQQEIKDLIASYILQIIRSTFKTSNKIKSVYFLFDFGCYSIRLDFVC